VSGADGPRFGSDPADRLSPVAGSVSSAGGVAGNIYDLGYQRYDGPRLGRRHAIWALFAYSLRGTFGIGRSGRAKLVPISLALLALLPALVAVGVTALLNRTSSSVPVSSPISYATFYGYISIILMLFCAAQAPELLGRDQRYHVLSLYFSRALVRTDYAIAKLGALLAAILLVFLVPQLVIFLGHVLSASDVPTAFADNLWSIPPVLVIAFAAAFVLGGISLAVAAFTPRRAYATAAIIALFIVPPIIAAIVVDVAPGGASRWIVLLVPGSILDGLNSYLFNVAPNSRLLQQVDLPGQVFAVAAMVVSIVSVGILVRRYRRIAA